MSTSRRRGQAAAAAVEEAPQVGRWRYIGGVERIYMHVPVTVQHGAVIEHAGPPADDGHWEPAGDAEVTHLPDNTSPAEVLELDAYGHPAYAGESLSGPATWPQPLLGTDDQDADAEQQQVQLDDHDTAGE